MVLLNLHEVPQPVELELKSSLLLRSPYPPTLFLCTLVPRFLPSLWPCAFKDHLQTVLF